MDTDKLSLTSESVTSESVTSEAIISETVSQKADRYERAARLLRLQEAKANSEAHAALQGRVTGFVVGVILIGAIAVGLYGCGR